MENSLLRRPPSNQNQIFVCWTRRRLAYSLKDPDLTRQINIVQYGKTCGIWRSFANRTMATAFQFMPLIFPWCSQLFLFDACECWWSWYSPMLCLAPFFLLCILAMAGAQQPRWIAVRIIFDGRGNWESFFFFFGTSYFWGEQYTAKCCHWLSTLVVSRVSNHTVTCCESLWWQITRLLHLLIR